MEEEIIKGYITIILGNTSKSLLFQISYMSTELCTKGSIAFLLFYPFLCISSWWLLKLYSDTDGFGVSPRMPIIMILGCLSQCLDHIGSYCVCSVWGLFLNSAFLWAKKWKRGSVMQFIYKCAALLYLSKISIKDIIMNGGCPEAAFISISINLSYIKF